MSGTPILCLTAVAFEGSSNLFPTMTGSERVNRFATSGEAPSQSGYLVADIVQGSKLMVRSAIAYRCIVEGWGVKDRNRNWECASCL